MASTTTAVAATPAAQRVASVTAGGRYSVARATPSYALRRDYAGMATPAGAAAAKAAAVRSDAPALNVEALYDEQAAVMEEVAHFKTQVENSLSTAAENYKRTVTNFAESKEVLTAEKQNLQARVEELDQDASVTKDRMAHIRSELANLQVEEMSLPAQLELAKAEEEMQHKAIEEARQAADARRKQVQAQADNLTMGVATYKRLGLELEPTNEAGRFGLRMSFSRIDAKDPAREFNFSVSLNNATNKFEIKECNPVPPDMHDVIKSLETATELRDYVIQMRKAFKRMVQ